MTREEAFHITLDAIAKLQWHVAMILEAKATEAEKVRNWVQHHITSGTYETHSEQLAACLRFQEQNVEVIEGLTKLCNGLSRNLKEIINPDKEDDGMSSFMSGFGSGSGSDGKSK